MPDSKIKFVKTVNFGRGLSGRLAASPFKADGVTNIRYSIYDTLGNVSSSRSNSGIYEVQVLGEGTGIYGAQLELFQAFSGSILWEITASNGNVVYAADELEFDSRVTRHLTAGQWAIDKTNSQMIFYTEDNVSEVGRFDLFDSNSSPSIESVFRRTRVISGSA